MLILRRENVQLIRQVRFHLFDQHQRKTKVTTHYTLKLIIDQKDYKISTIYKGHAPNIDP